MSAPVTAASARRIAALEADVEALLAMMGHQYTGPLSGEVARKYAERVAALLASRTQGPVPEVWDEADTMCPNCVTPWKCNGPHLHMETVAARRVRGDADPLVVAALEANDLGAAWRETEAALPKGWRPISVHPDEDPDEGHDDDRAYWASTCSPAWFNGEYDSDDEHVEGTGPTPVAALRALAKALRTEADPK